MLKSLSIVLPMYNEEFCVKDTIAKMVIVANEATKDFEIIIVDDASTDTCGLIADEISKGDSRIKVKHLGSNRKLGGALKAGFAAAQKEYILYSDIDQPFDFTEIKKAVVLITEEKADLVAAYRINRFIEGVRRYIYSVCYNFLIKIIFGIKIKDVNFSFKLIRRDLIKQLNLFSEGSFICAEMIVKCRRRKAKIMQFGTLYYPRRSGKSRLSSLNVIFKILKEAFLFRFGFLK